MVIDVWGIMDIQEAYETLALARKHGIKAKLVKLKNFTYDKYCTFNFYPECYALKIPAGIYGTQQYKEYHAEV